jgi:F-type H+-transporting ATPase subunit a
MAGEAHEEGGLVFHPLDQFEIKPLFGDGPIHWYTPTNVTLWLGLCVLVVVALFVFGTRGRAVIPGRVQSIAEMAYGMVYKMVEEIAGHDGVKYFPMIMSLFVFILFANMLGLLPMSFTPTSHIAVTAVLGFGVFIFVTLLGLIKHGTHFLGLFWMSDAPLILRPIIAVIEVISYFVRPVSHSIRLAGNIRATDTASIRTTETHQEYHPRREIMEGEIANLGQFIGAGLAAIGSGIAAMGVGNVAANFLAGALRNPSAAASQTATLFIGLAFAEALGIFSFLVALLLMFAV